MNKKYLEEKHISVLLKELVDSIKIFDNKQNIIVDCTLWMAGHWIEVIKKMNSWDIFIWFDADIRNLELARKRLENFEKDWVKIITINSNFSNLKSELEKIWIKKVTWIYYDLWISSLHVDESERGFSFKQDWPLDMRFDNNSWIKASDIINFYTDKELQKILSSYWEVTNTNKIVWEIIKRRKIKKFDSTLDFANFLDDVSKIPKTKTKVFQALRIEVNKELEVIENSLKQAVKLLDIWWNIFAISFHSLEDRIVKDFFRDESKDCICTDIICSCKHKKSLKILTKKPILPTTEEIKINSRSRSAKARFATKI